MSSLYVDVLPLALGAAISPGVLTLELLILSGKVRPKLRAWLYLLGAVAVLVAFSFLALTVLSVTVVGHRSDALLARVNGHATRYSRQINAGICFVFAALLGVRAVKDLLD